MTSSKERLPAPRLRLMASVGRLSLGGVRRLSPALFNFLAAKRPQLRLAWGRNEIHLRRDGLVRVPREAAAQQDVTAQAAPDQGLPAARPPVEDADVHYMFDTPEEGIQVDDRPVSLARAAMEAEVQERMGERPDADPDDLAIDDDDRDPSQINEQLLHVRDLLQGLDDVEDHELISQIDEELYKLYKAADYKIRRHHASEAKVELGKLFKM